MHNKSGVTPTQIHHWISGIPFPSKKKELIEYARNKGADSGILDMLEKMPDREFKNESEITDQLYENSK